MQLQPYNLPCDLEQIYANTTFVDLAGDIIKISGKDAKRFLQGQLTCHLEDINQHSSHIGAHCNPQGRIIFLFRLFQCQDGYYLVLPLGMADIALRALKKYAVFFKVQLDDVSSSFVIAGLFGKRSADFLSQFSLHVTQENVVEGFNNGWIIKLPGSRMRYLIISQPNSAIYLELKKTISPAPFHLWSYLDILSGMPNIYPATTEKFLPHDINLHELQGISFNKGCYTGQEIIARMQYRGKLKIHLYPVQLTTLAKLSIGDELLYERNQELTWAGTIVDICQENESNYLALVTGGEMLIDRGQVFATASKDVVAIHPTVLNI